MDFLVSGDAAANALRADLLNPAKGGRLVANTPIVVTTLATLTATAFSIITALVGSTLAFDTLDYATEGDGGGARYDWKPNSTRTADGVLVVNPTGNTGAGRLVLRTAGHGRVSLRQFGVVTGTGAGSPQNAAVQAAFNICAAAGLEVSDESGNYFIDTANPVTLPSKLRFQGDRYQTVFTGAATGNLFTATNTGSGYLRGFTANDSAAPTAAPKNLALLKAVANFDVSDYETNGFYGAQFTTTAATYASVALANMSQNVTQKDFLVRAPNATATTGTVAVGFAYCATYRCINGTVDGCGQGIVAQGGDANPVTGNGILANARKCTDGFFSGLTVKNSYGGGVWSSMAQDLKQYGCQVENCLDVGMDIEGGYRVFFHGGSAVNCTNGNLSTFFYNRDVGFVGVTSVQTSAAKPHYRGYNSTQDQNNKLVKLLGCVLRTEGAISTVDCASGPVDRFIMRGCELENVKIAVNFLNMRDIEIDSNNLLFTVASPGVMNGIEVGGTTGVGNIVKVKNNTVRSLIGQPTGSNAILVSLYDFNSNPPGHVIDNETEGFTNDLNLKWSGQNAGTGARFFVDKNRFGAGSYVRDDSAAVNPTNPASIVQWGEDNKRLDGTPFPSAIPNTNRWDQGSRIKLTNVVLSTAGTTAYESAICTTTGNAGGTWGRHSALALLAG